jgi:hypothetical protein
MSLTIDADKETYQIIFCSRNSNVTDGVANLNNVSFYVNWAAILPDKYKKYSCSFVFKSENYAGLLTSNGFVNVNVGRTQIFDGTTESSNLGMIYPVYLNVTAGSQLSFYNSTNNDNNPIILYPSNNIVTIKLKTFAGGAMANMPHYSLILNLRPCV